VSLLGRYVGVVVEATCDDAKGTDAEVAFMIFAVADATKPGKRSLSFDKDR
jgi:hypothetical protein